jgi:hypothetical protein
VADLAQVADQAKSSFPDQLNTIDGPATERRPDASLAATRSRHPLFIIFGWLQEWRR